MTPTKQATRTSNDELSATTSAALVHHARASFAQIGFRATSVDGVAAAAALSKGAVYYHFTDKRGLFEAAFRDAQQELVGRIRRAVASAPDPLTAVKHGCTAFLEIAVDDELRQIVLVDGPGVLGWARWRAIDREYGLGLLEEGLRACESAGLQFIESVEVVALVLSGAMNEGVFVVADTDDRDRVLRQITRLLHAMVDSFISPPT